MFGVVLKNKREELGMTLQEVSRITGMPPKLISSLENDRFQDFIGGIKEIERLTKLYARKLNITIDTDFFKKKSKIESENQENSSEAEIPLFLLISNSKKHAY